MKNLERPANTIRSTIYPLLLLIGFRNTYVYP